MRAGCAVSRVADEPVLAGRGRDVAVTAAVLALTAVAFAAVADHGILAHIQRADDWWLRLMISGRVAPVTVAAIECPEGNEAPLVATSDPGGRPRS